MGLEDFSFLSVVLPFFVVGVVEGIDVAADASSVVAARAAIGGVFFLLFFVLAAV